MKIAAHILGGILFFGGIVMIFGHFILVYGLILEEWFVVLIGLMFAPITYFAWPVISSCLEYSLWPISVLLISIAGYILSMWADES